MDRRRPLLLLFRGPQIDNPETARQRRYRLHRKCNLTPYLTQKKKRTMKTNHNLGHPYPQIPYQLRNHNLRIKVLPPKHHNLSPPPPRRPRRRRRHDPASNHLLRPTRQMPSHHPRPRFRHPFPCRPRSKENIPSPHCDYESGAGEEYAVRERFGGCEGRVRGGDTGERDRGCVGECGDAVMRWDGKGERDAGNLLTRFLYPF